MISSAPRHAYRAGFDLHANRTVRADDRAGLERLCQYLVRPPLAQERLALLPDGRIFCTLELRLYRVAPDTPLSARTDVSFYWLDDVPGDPGKFGELIGKAVNTTGSSTLSYTFTNVVVRPGDAVFAVVPYSDYAWIDDFYDSNGDALDEDEDGVPDAGKNPFSHGDNNTWARTTPIFFHASNERATPTPACAHVTFNGSGSASPSADGGGDVGIPGDAGVLPVAIPGGYDLEWNRWRFSLPADYQYVDLSFFTQHDEDNTGHLFAVRIDGQLIYSGRAGIDHAADELVEKKDIAFPLRKGLHQIEVHMDDQEYATADNDPDFHCNDYDGPPAFLDAIVFHATPGAACNDQTPPEITCPAGLTVECSAAGGVPASDAAVAAFLTGASATDAIDPTLTITHDAPTFFPNGTTVVTFTAEDDAGNAASCSAAVTVSDTTPPVISAQWVPRKPGSRTKFFVAFSATDTCDLAPSVTGVIRTPSVAGWKIKKEKTKAEVEVEFDLHKRKVEIEAPNPDAILAQMQTYGGLLISNGASVEADWEKDRDEYEIEVDKKGNFEVEGPSATLQVTAVDATGNRSTFQVTRTR